jgi:hypothetical protein
VEQHRRQHRRQPPLGRQHTAEDWLKGISWLPVTLYESGRFINGPRGDMRVSPVACDARGTDSRSFLPFHVRVGEFYTPLLSTFEGFAKRAEGAWTGRRYCIVFIGYEKTLSGVRKKHSMRTRPKTTERTRPLAHHNNRGPGRTGLTKCPALSDIALYQRKPVSEPAAVNRNIQTTDTEENR